MAIDNLYDEITSFTALSRAFREVTSGKQMKEETLRFEYDLEGNLHDMSYDLRHGMVPKVHYKSFYVYVPKTRKVIYIDCASKVIQRSIYDSINPKLAKSFISDTYACIPGRGQLAAMLRVRSWMEQARRSPDPCYYFKFDIAKFFYRINHEILIAILSHKFNDERLIDLLSYYIDGTGTPFGIPEGFDGTEIPIEDMVYDIGIPIGGGLSHALGNLYLDPLDQYIKRDLKCERYSRYMDDGLIFDYDKDRLANNARRIEEYAWKHLQMTFNHKAALRPTTRGVEWVGCNIYEDHVHLRKSTTLHVKHNLARIMQQYHDGEITLEDVRQPVASYQALSKYCDMDNFNDFIWNHWFVLTKGDINEARRLSYCGYIV